MHNPYAGPMKRQTPLIAAFFALLPMAAAAESLTQDQILQAALLPGWRLDSGQHMAGLSLALAPEWKTYWRSPGKAGIPPLFDWAGSRNVKSVQIHWPSPTVFHTNGLQAIGYHDGVVLPLQVTPLDPGQPVRLRMHVDLGICKDICMPATVEVSADLAAPGHSDESINAALKALPEVRDAARGNNSCTVEPITDGLRVTARLQMPAQGGNETVVFEAADRSIWVDEAVTTRQGGILISVTEMVASSGAPFALDRSGLTITVLGKGRTLEIQGCPAP
jgi:DsbC/DsbD-like thiol-disulfide interchange protein